MKILTIIGARPQFIKASVVSKALMSENEINEIIVHTGQHFDQNMSDVFFSQLGIPRPDYQLDINGGLHGQMTGKMLTEIEKIILKEQPDRVMVYGDTTSTLAGSLAASKLHIPVAHVEAGLRSFNMRMPEEINRILTDQLSDMLFCPTREAVGNLQREGFEYRPAQILMVGDVMEDAARFFAPNAVCPADLVAPENFILSTFHRAENTDDVDRLGGIVDAINTIHDSIAPVVLPIHPRTRAALARHNLALHAQVIDPVGYFEMLWLLNRCQLVLTDSGGVQKEAYFFGRACVTMRDQTEWVELVNAGANELAGAESHRIVDAARRNLGRHIEDPEQLYGGGKAALSITAHLKNVAAH